MDLNVFIMKKELMFFLAFSLLLVFSCNDESVTSDNDDQQITITPFEDLSLESQQQLFIEQFDYVLTTIRTIEVDWRNTQDILETAQAASTELYEIKHIVPPVLDNTLDVTQFSLDSYVNRLEAENPALVDPFEKDLWDAIYLSESYDQFLSLLDGISLKYASSSRVDGRDPSATFVSNYSVSEVRLKLKQINSVMSPILMTIQTNDESEYIIQGWWKSWGRCVAGITGGILIGGVTGAGVGSVVPAIGTTIGGIIGAVGGGLSGAAAACE
jgi:hypothetical protein